jgi:hypothetical protein
MVLKKRHLVLMVLPDERPIALPILLAMTTKRLRDAYYYWWSLTRGRGVFQLQGAGGWRDLMIGTPLFEERAAAIHALPGRQPLDWTFGYHGGDFGIYRNRWMLGQTLGDLPDRDAMKVTLAGQIAAMEDGQPRLDRIWGQFDGHSMVYDRLALPVRAANGRLQHLVTISDELARAPIDTLACPGLATRRASNGRWLTLIE